MGDMHTDRELATRGVGDAAAQAEVQHVRVARRTRAGVLAGLGIAVAFTGPLHEQFSFDQWVLVAALALIGVAMLLEYLALRGTPASDSHCARRAV